jgi:hypothetical protein
MTDPVDYLAQHGPRTAAALAQACGMAIADTYEALVHAEAAGWARVKRRGARVELADSRGGACYWEAIKVEPFIGAAQ